MAASVIGALRVNLGLDSAQFARGARGVNAPLRRMRAQFLAVAGVAAAFGTAIIAAARAGANEIDEAAKSARRLDASIGGFRALELAASEAGVNLSGLTNDIQTMNRELASIGTSGNGQRALDALGLRLSDLEGLDADERLATIADQVQALGLDAGETTAVLRDLGVRNREMALLVLQGGDAIRAARSDIEEYGLALDDVDAAGIEAANDSVGRLGLITQYASQQIALQLVPAMGRMADAMTDSLREGGLLRSVIDGLVGSLQTIISVVSVAVLGFGARYVGALLAARIATFSLVGAIGVLRTAMMTTGIGLLIVGVGYAVSKFSELVTATGGVGNALELMANVAHEVLTVRIPQAALSGVQRMRAWWSAMVADFLRAVNEMRGALFGMFADASRAATSIPIMGPLISAGFAEAAASIATAGEAIEETADEFDAAGLRFLEDSQILMGAATAPLNSLQALRDHLAETADETESSEESAERLAEALSDLEGEAGGAGGAVGELGEELDEATSFAEGFAEAISKATRNAADMGREFASSVLSGIDGVTSAWGEFVVNGFRDFEGFVENVLRSFQNMLSEMIAQQARSGLMNLFGFGGGGGGKRGGGGLLGGLFAGWFDGGGNIPRGQFGVVGEHGPEFVSGPAQVTSRADTARMMGAAQALNVTVTMDPSTGNLGAFVRNAAGQVVAEAAPGIASQAVGQAQASFRASKAGWSPA